MGRYILVHDIGTTGDKAVIFDVDRHDIVASATVEYPTHYPHTLWAEQKPEDWWSAFAESTKMLLKVVNPSEIEAISFSGQMMACLPVDRDGNALRNAIIWMDQRSINEVEFIRTTFTDYEFYSVTGNRLSPTYPIAKILWLKRNDPNTYNRTYLFLQPKDYIVARLTGTFQTDFSDASLTAMLDIFKRTWALNILNEIGIDSDKLPPIKPSTAIVGEMNSDVAHSLGFPHRPPIVLGCGDGVCTAVGACVTDVYDSYTYLGASAWLSLISNNPLIDKSMRLFNMVYIDPYLYTPVGTMQTAGAALRWFRDNVFLLEKFASSIVDISPYELIDREAEKSSVGANGLIFLPYLMGERAPWWSSYARGVLLGLTLSHSHSDVARAVLEGIALNLGLIMVSFLENDVDVKEPVALVGGGAKSSLWPKIISNVYNRRVAVLRYREEVAALGAGITAAYALKIYSSLREAKNVNKPLQIYSPTESEVTIYKKLLEIFKRSYLALEEVFREIDTLYKSTSP
uniref:Xylulokinase n=1 Tax=Ignisphaera aggregans TaxID=334771 RepID=A0A7J2U4Z5_9CREN